jgi:hypothetical protein
MKTYSVSRAESAQPDWSRAQVLTDFCLPWDHEAPAHTEFRALWNEASLHFRFDVIDHDLVLGTGASLKERVLDSDRVEIFFTPELSLTPYYGFEMSPSGEALIYRARHYREIDWDWTCPSLQLSTCIHESLYSVEGSIPIETLRDLQLLKPGSAQLWVGVFRADFIRQEDGTLKRRWMPWVNPQTEKPDFHVPSAFGRWQLMD